MKGFQTYMPDKRSSWVEIVFELDGSKLRQNYKGGSIDYWYTKGEPSSKIISPDRLEAEDRIYLDSPFLSPLNRFLRKIIIFLPEGFSYSKFSYYEKEKVEAAIKFGDDYNINVVAMSTSGKFLHPKGKTVDPRQALSVIEKNFSKKEHSEYEIKRKIKELWNSINWKHMNMDREAQKIIAALHLLHNGWIVYDFLKYFERDYKYNNGIPTRFFSVNLLTIKNIFDQKERVFVQEMLYHFRKAGFSPREPEKFFMENFSWEEDEPIKYKTSPDFETIEKNFSPLTIQTLEEHKEELKELEALYPEIYKKTLREIELSL